MRKQYSKDFEVTIIYLYQTGESVTHLFKEYRISSATIYK